jgi:putative hemolysin
MASTNNIINSNKSLKFYWTSLNYEDNNVYMSELNNTIKADDNTTPLDYKTRNDIIELIKKDPHICKHNVDFTYVVKQLKNDAMILVLIDVTKNKCMGFILANEIPDKKGVYLDIICAHKGAGTLLLNFFHKTIFDLDYEYIELTASANVITYYTRFGYTFRFSCNNDKHPPIGLSRTLKNRNYKTTNIPYAGRNAYFNKNYMNFMYNTLYPKRFGKMKGECEYPYNEHNAYLSRKNYFKKNCAKEGFKMIFCKKKMGGRYNKTVRKFKSQ